MALGISKHFTFKPPVCLLKCSQVYFTAICPMTYDTLLALVFSHYHSNKLILFSKYFRGISIIYIINFIDVKNIDVFKTI